MFFCACARWRRWIGGSSRRYSEQGHPAYHPALLLKVWLYAYALGMTSSRRLEQRIREDLAFRYLAGGATPDYWALNEFRKRHGRGMNDVFTQVVELARSLGMGKLGHVAIDSTRIAANAAADSVETRAEVARGAGEDSASGFGAGSSSARRRIPTKERGRRWPRRLWKVEPAAGEIPARMERLKKAGMQKLSRTDQDSRFLRERKGFVLGYTATVAVSEDHLIVAQQVSQASTDNGLLVPMVERWNGSAGSGRDKWADSGFFSQENLQEMERRGIDAYVPDSHLARELNRGGGCADTRPPAIRRNSDMRRKLRSPAGRADATDDGKRSWNR